jgi:hypothetical protein
MKKLEKLKIHRGSILSPSTSGPPPKPFTLPITLLSLFNVSIPSPIDPSSLPLVRSLHLSNQVYQPARLLLPQLDSLHVLHLHSTEDIDLLLQQSTSITSLCVSEGDIRRLSGASKTVIMERIVELRVKQAIGHSSDSTLASIINGSQATKKLIYDGLYLRVAGQVSPPRYLTSKVVKEACKKKEIELWRKNFDIGNGKVDLEK